jgi:hypothetical protein
MLFRPVISSKPGHRKARPTVCESAYGPLADIDLRESRPISILRLLGQQVLFQEAKIGIIK